MKEEKELAVAGNRTRAWSVAGTYLTTWLLLHWRNIEIRANEGEWEQRITKNDWNEREIFLFYFIEVFLYIYSINYWVLVFITVFCSFIVYSINIYLYWIIQRYILRNLLWFVESNFKESSCFQYSYYSSCKIYTCSFSTNDSIHYKWAIQYWYYNERI